MSVQISSLRASTGNSLEVEERSVRDAPNPSRISSAQTPSTSFTAPFLLSPAPKDVERPKTFLPLPAEEPDAKARKDEREMSSVLVPPINQQTHFATQAQSSLKDSKV
jgi:hypothetical protein